MNNSGGNGALPSLSGSGGIALNNPKPNPLGSYGGYNKNNALGGGIGGNKFSGGMGLGSFKYGQGGGALGAAGSGISGGIGGGMGLRNNND